MRYGTSLATAAAVLLAACAEKPAPGSTGNTEAGAPGSSAGAEADGARTGALTVPLSPRSLGDAELTLFMPRTEPLRRTPPPGATRLPGADGGELLYGSIPVAARGQRPAGRVHFAVLFAKGADAGADDAPWRLLVDRDLDGDLAEERPVEAVPRVEETEVGGRKVRASAARFPAVRTALPGGGTHDFSVAVYASGGSAVADVRSAVALASTARVLGAERNVVIYDSNANARFGDLYRGPLIGVDDIGIDLDGDGRITGGEVRPLARRVYHEGRADAIAVSEDAATLAVEAVEVAPGAIAREGAAPGEEFLVQLSSPEYGLLGPLPASAVPDGTHLLVAYGFARRDADGAEWKLSGQWFTQAAEVATVPPNGSVSVRFGPPLVARAALAFVEGARRAIIKIAFAGSGREDAIVIAGGRPRLGKWRVAEAGAGGAELGSGDLAPSGLLPGLWVAEWRAPGGLEEGRKLVFEIVPDLGPFAEGFDGRTAFEYGVSTPVTLVVIDVEKGSQAEGAGVERGDVIVSYDGREVRNEIDMSLAVRDATRKAVGTVEFVVRRKGELKRFDVKPGPLGVSVSLVMPVE